MARNHRTAWQWIIAGLLAAAAGSLSQACSDSGSREVDGGNGPAGCPDQPPPFEPNPLDGIAASFVINSARLGNVHDGEAFDLDCVNTGPEGYLPPDGPGGADNQFGALMIALQDAGLDMDFNSEMQRSIDNGRGLILFRLVDVDDWSEDGGALYLAVYDGVDTDSDPTNNFSGHEPLLADDSSLTRPDDLMSTRTWFTNGVLHDTVEADRDLHSGDYDASGAEVALRFPFAHTVGTLRISRARVVWDLERAPVGTPPLDGTITGGMLGGHIFLGDAAKFLADASSGSAGEGIDEDTILTLLFGQADMDVIPEGFTDEPCTEATADQDCFPGRGCEQDSDRDDAFFCYEYEDNPDAISVSFVFSAVSCDLAGIHHGTP
ncbi:MAG: hypothetical protein HY907_16680 [Deltaproteobacteria bacterium]|nr:hypothetical protein [Deltaproteobacteria bacterium]